MDKPITVARQDFMTGLVKLCNEAQLPAFVKVDIMSQAVALLKKKSDEEYERENEAYQKALQDDEQTNAEQPQPFTGTVTMNGR